MEENKVYEKDSFGWLREQAKKDGFDNIRNWQNWKRYQNIKNIDQVEEIVKKNKIDIKDKNVFNRFWSKVDIKDNINECWIWKSNTIINGYGQFSYNFDSVLAHRMAYKLSKGNIDVRFDGLEVQHSCNNRLCCNPNHLELGNKSKNMHYMFECNRSNRYKGINSILGLAEDQIDEICDMYKDGDWTEKDIGKMFGISQSTIHRILTKERIINSRCK